jgi:PIN domain nuclease of toxin-antitoxin system
MQAKFVDTPAAKQMRRVCFLVAQATVDDILLVTVDRRLAKYPGAIRKV